MSAAGKRPQRVLFLFTQVFAEGGIQRFNKTILDACGRSNIHCQVLSLHDLHGAQTGDTPQPNLTVQGFAGDRRRFVVGMARAILAGSYDRILVGHINFLILAAAMMLLRPFHRAEKLLIAHGIEVWSGIGWPRRVALATLDRILCVSTYTRQRLLEQSPGLKPKRLLIFPNALADSWRRIEPLPLPRPSRNRFILSVTRIERGDRYKGIATVIEGFSMLADRSLEYLVVGKGDDLEFLKLMAERFGVQNRVRFLSGISDRELISLYRDCEAFILPSGKEGFGIVFLEAMFFGAPVIAAREKGAVDVVQDEETGLLVPFGDSIAIKESIERILSDVRLRERLRAAASALVLDEGPFTFSQFSKRTARVFAFNPEVQGLAG